MQRCPALGLSDARTLFNSTPIKTVKNTAARGRRAVAGLTDALSRNHPPPGRRPMHQVILCLFSFMLLIWLNSYINDTNMG